MSRLNVPVWRVEALALILPNVKSRKRSPIGGRRSSDEGLCLMRSWVFWISPTLSLNIKLLFNPAICCRVLSYNWQFKHCEEYVTAPMYPTCYYSFLRAAQTLHVCTCGGLAQSTTEALAAPTKLTCKKHIFAIKTLKVFTTILIHIRLLITIFWEYIFHKYRQIIKKRRKL